MGNQAVGLVAAELERRGIATVALQLLREVAERVRPPRALFVPFPHGYPLDRPDEPSRQHAVLEAALALLEGEHSSGPVLVDFEPDPACDIFDFLAFQNLFLLGDPCACEIEPDPACDIFDFLAFQNEFLLGCP